MLARVFCWITAGGTQVTDDGVGDDAGVLQGEDDISCEEVATAIGKLKHRKAEMLKGGGGTGLSGALSHAIDVEKG